MDEATKFGLILILIYAILLTQRIWIYVLKHIIWEINRTYQTYLIRQQLYSLPNVEYVDININNKIIKKEDLIP